MKRQGLRATFVLGAFLGAVGCDGPAGPEPATKPRLPSVARTEPPRPKTQGPLSVKSDEPLSPTSESIVPPPPDAVRKAKQATASPTAAPATAAVDVTKVDLPGLDKYLTGLKGKVVAVDAWATWCAPCVQKFPKFVALSQKHSGKDVVFVSLSVDLEEDLDKAKDFLEKQHASFSNFVVTAELTDLQEKFAFEGIPQYLLFDGKGGIVLRTDKLEELEAKLAAIVKGM